MPDVLGLDTSNYTTSAALLHDGLIQQSKRLLPVKKGEKGLRQSDAVFHHVQQLPEVLEALSFSDSTIAAVGVSNRPRSMDGSYMPCFLVGVAAAKTAALSLKVPFHFFSHQQGHIAAALYSAGKIGLLSERFLAFHVSGGTTEAILCQPDKENIFSTQIVAESLDLKAGQAVDRVGVMLGLPFPAGPELEKLALKAQKSYSVRASMKGCNCSLSGVENQCRSMLEKGTPKEEIAAFCLQSIYAALDAMAEALLHQYGELPIVFAGGVMSNSILREKLSQKFGAWFAEPVFSADNAAGIAVLAALKEGIYP
ncbi:peptidase M22 [Thermocaproicibacter melissae]|uniref:Kae1-like domain-containing protein n=1 Tax=Thermocaproicibacter melissae TaxID=2966552 RepID=UPI0024B04FBD|nr:peptidase M22 [Thermocaproicibacter melissae]WBY64819.1 peptidase M22 [Thermocaproicibacter melissae]